MFTGKDLNNLKPDLAIVSDYGLIIPKEIFTIPRHQTLNIHFSKLPKFRGPSPVQYTILNGEKSAWITIILMDEGMDTGDIVFQKEVSSINTQQLTIDNETTESLYRKLFKIAAMELSQVIHDYTNNKLKPLRQLNSAATYTKSFTRQDGFISHQALDKAIKGKGAIKMERMFRALSPWPGVWTIINIPQPKRLKLLKSHIENNRLVLDEVQLEGKKPVSWKQFIEGYPDFSFLK